VILICLVLVAADDTSASQISDFQLLHIISLFSILAIFASDPGLASSHPKWWNASPNGCVLIGLHPRGLSSVFQRSVQWGNDIFSKVFGVDCKNIDLYAYFSCTIRNRLEVWNSPRLISPMVGRSSSEPWNSTLSRPTKLLEGSRGGSAYMCKLFVPPDGEHYGIDQQARMQFLSVLVTAAILSNPVEEFPDIIRNELGLSEGLSVIFSTLFQRLVIMSSIAELFVLVMVTRLLHNATIGLHLLEGTSLLCLIAGYIGLLMIGGNPRVRIVRKPIHPTIESRLPPKSLKEKIMVEFGSLQGSTYTGDRGFGLLSPHILRDISQYDLEIRRPRSWYVTFVFFSVMIAIGIAAKIVAVRYNTMAFAGLWVVYFVTTALFRGLGLSGPEEWMIPEAQMRPNSEYGAVLVGLTRKT
jgi:hypothetical protein